MNYIYNRQGKVIAWLNKDDIHHLGGSQATVLDDEIVYGHSEQHLGLFIYELFRDHFGGIIAFIKCAQGGPNLPIPFIPPIPAIPPIPYIPSLRSRQSWKQFIAK